MATIIGTNSNNTLTGTTSADTLIGQAGNDTLNGSGGNDRLNGGVGTDILNGGTGIDTADYSNLVINGTTYTGATAGVTVNLGLTSAQNTGGAGSDTLTSIENVIGTNFADRLTGNSTNNVLSGLNGDDSLLGGDGNDVLNGGAGVDTMDGGTGSDTYVVDHPLDMVIDLGSTSDIDTVQSSITYTLGGTIERLTLTGAGSINGSGNAQNNLLTGNGANNILFGLLGNDQLVGGAGNDTLLGGFGDDRLNGGAGADTMNGGEGNDVYVVDHIGDVAAETFAEEGVDTVQASVNHTLNDAIEHLTLTGSSTINGTGNGLNNILTGNSANNVLSGLDGSDELFGNGGNDRLSGGEDYDRLFGGAGADLLSGGAGGDIFFYRANDSPAGTGKDIILDFTGAGAGFGDVIGLREIDANGLLAGDQNFTWIGGAAFTAAGQVRYAGGLLQGNTDADAAAELEIQLIGAPALYVNPASNGTDIFL